MSTEKRIAEKRIHDQNINCLLKKCSWNTDNLSSIDKIILNQLYSLISKL